MTITINAPDQVHAFLELWERRNELAELKDIHQSASGLVHTFTFAEMPLKDVAPKPLRVQAFEPPCGIVELPEHPTAYEEFKKGLLKDVAQGNATPAKLAEKFKDDPSVEKSIRRHEKHHPDA